jgi:hypothetical protein
VYQRLLAQVRPYTMVHESGVIFTMQQVEALIANDVPGAVAECGVWRGGCALATLLIQKERFGKVLRPVWMFDSFEGLPGVDAGKDGPLAIAWQKGETKDFLNNCKAEEERVIETFQEFGFVQDRDFFVCKGWFNDTLPVYKHQIAEKGGIALLRLDGDWYDSTITIYDHLEPLLAEGGIGIIDNYYAWDGCARATHDYFSKIDKPYRIKSMPHNYAAYFVKSVARQDYDTF